VIPLSSWFENLIFGSGPASTVTSAIVITVIGSGGKTSLIWHLAAAFSTQQDRKILVTPTTKMYVPCGPEKTHNHYYDHCQDHYHDGTGGDFPVPAPGITLAGNFNGESGKLESLSPADLSKVTTGYDIVLIEGDGARGLPLKAWDTHEPVIPEFTDMTIGILPLWPLGMPASEKIIHRLPRFLSLTGAVPGENIRTEHIQKLITGRETDSGEPAPGLFARARGKKILFFNQTEDDASLAEAREIAGLLAPVFRGELYRIIAGSVKRNTLVEI